MNKKAAELSINIIIIAILGLIVLIVLAFVFKDQIGKSAKSFTGINDKTNTCINNPSADECKEFLKPQSSSHTFNPRTSSYYFNGLRLK